MPKACSFLACRLRSALVRLSYGVGRIVTMRRRFVKPPFFEPIAMRESSSFRSSLS
jgi:hypothetical protein